MLHLNAAAGTPCPAAVSISTNLNTNQAMNNNSMTSKVIREYFSELNNVNAEGFLICIHKHFISFGISLTKKNL